ncbi:17889_t:CDS:2 [Acaulospora morrowiae]|uniref:17889_t:CDS:1 n=1 Tax=Acaulospora morrowiae TaxID=94023 RepID=A0A9N9BDC9_9GLOM|nr:17889_t:CDS:2 [Acaulospora morrowiae]
MRESVPKEHRISIDETISSPSNSEIIPNNNKKIARVVCSPNMKYVATASLEDSSVYVWKFPDRKKGEYELKFNHSLDLKEVDLMEPIKVSDSKDVLIGNCCKNSLILEIRDPGNNPIKILNAQEDLKGRIDCSGFLKNGELVIVEGDPVYQEKVLILLDIPFVIMQWNLVTRKFEAQYELNWSLTMSWKSIGMELNKSFDGTGFGIMNFIMSEKGKFLLVYFEEEHLFYAINLSTYSKSKNSRKLDLAAEKDFIVPGYIIRSHDRLRIESLSRNMEWEEEIRSEPGKDGKIDLSYREEIKETIRNILETNQPDQKITQGPKPDYKGQLYTWNVECEKISNVFVARLTAKRYYEVSVDELAKYVKKMKNEVYEEESNPLLPAIEKIVGYEKKADEKFQNIDKRFDELIKLINQEKIKSKQID